MGGTFQVLDTDQHIAFGITPRTDDGIGDGDRRAAGKAGPAALDRLAVGQIDRHPRCRAGVRGRVGILGRVVEIGGVGGQGQLAAGDQIRTGAAGEGIVAQVAFKEICTGAGIEDVVAFAAEDAVVTAVA
ncbi:MAG: hypothetical protein CMO29_11280 [Tistrella sp.]|nr:hypothetical protein [Tistrella sp.]